MRASDLTDDDIGREFLVTMPTGGSERRRVTFEGFTRRPPQGTAAAVPYWLILKTGPSARGAMQFRTLSGDVFAGLLVRSNSQVWPLEVEWAVSSEGEIVELAVRTS